MPAVPTLRELRAFVEVYRQGKVAAAADRMALTHSAVSVLLRQLEEKLNLRLFDRTTRSLRPTDAAVELVEAVERLLRETDGLLTRAQEIAELRTGVIRVAMTPIVAQTLLPRLLMTFGSAHPDVRVVVDDCAPADFLPLIESGRVDFGIGAPTLASTALQRRILYRDALALVGTKLPGTSAVHWKTLKDWSVITLRQGYGLRAAIDAAAAEAGVTVHFRYEVTLLSTAFAMATQGLGVVILPTSLAHAADLPELSIRRLQHPSVSRDICAVYRKSAALSAQAREFCDTAEHILGLRQALGTGHRAAAAARLTAR